MGGKVCFLVTEHPFQDARIFKKEAQTLHRNGYDVTMIVPRRKGLLYDIKNAPYTEEFQDERFVFQGIKIITYEQYPYDKQFKQLYYQLIKDGHWNDPLTLLGLEVQADIYHAHEFYSLYSGIGIKMGLKKKGKSPKLIFDSHELFPEEAADGSINKEKFILPMFQTMLKKTDYIFTVSQSIKKRYKETAPEIPVEIIYNSPPLPDLSKQNRASGSFCAVHEGAVTRDKMKWQKIIDITEECNRYFPFTFLIIGGARFGEDEKLRIPGRLKEKILVKPWVNYDSLPLYLQRADAGWIDLNADASLNNKFAMPNKFFSYLANGLPVITGDCLDMADFIDQYKCGCVIRSGNPDAVSYARCFYELYKNPKERLRMGLRAREIMEDQFSWGKMEKKILLIYQGLLAKQNERGTEE